MVENGYNGYSRPLPHRSDCSRDLLHCTGILKFVENKFKKRLVVKTPHVETLVRIQLTETGLERISKCLLEDVKAGLINVDELLDHPFVNLDEYGCTEQMKFSKAIQLINRFCLEANKDYF